MLNQSVGRGAGEYDLGVKECACDPGGDGDQFPLAAEYFDLPGTREFGQIHGASATDTGGVRFIGSDGRKLRQEFAGVNEEILEAAVLFRFRKLLQRMGVVKAELRNRSAP